MILLIAAVLRLYKLGSIPVSMYIDEIAIGVDAKSIAQTGRDMHGHSWLTPMFLSYGDYKLPVYIWIATGVRGPPALSSCGSIDGFSYLFYFR
ncbi:MAG: hypothetical protein UX00_C0008G0003 [Microgenomates group bacterium GW2011_GWB1_45_17]|nr:MAG: hypothetical protein UX00_C0008G0003 [Microgenomates group bacterium GW2011_GWB1_45_17]